MKYAFAGSRKALKWTNGEITWEELRERFQHPVRTMETMAEYRAMTTAQKTEVKDVGRSAQKGCGALPFNGNG